jgi:hypothetical protein
MQLLVSNIDNNYGYTQTSSKNVLNQMRLLKFQNRNFQLVDHSERYWGRHIHIILDTPVLTASEIYLGIFQQNKSVVCNKCKSKTSHHDVDQMKTLTSKIA